MIKDCLWNKPADLRAAASALAAEGFDQAAQGCKDRADKVDYLLQKFGPNPKNARAFEEPVDAR